MRERWSPRGRRVSSAALWVLSVVFARLWLFLRANERPAVVQVLRKPEEKSLSPARWKFVDELWGHHEAAGRLKLALIVEAIRDLNEVNDTGGTASTETIRKMFKGLTVPVHWPTVQATLYVLSSMAGYDPKAPRESWHGDEYDSFEDSLRKVWSKALDDPLRGKPGGWGGGYSDEPPF